MLIKMLISLRYLKLLLLLSSLWLYIFVMFSSISQNITNFSIIKNTLYHYNSFCTLLKMTWSIIDKKIDEFIISKVTATVTVIILVCFGYIFVKLKTPAIPALLIILDIIIFAFISCSKWLNLLFLKKIISLKRLKLLPPLLLLWLYISIMFLLIFFLILFVVFSKTIYIILIALVN